jgi:hypothetical protein
MLVVCLGHLWMSAPRIHWGLIENKKTFQNRKKEKKIG